MKFVSLAVLFFLPLLSFSQDVQWVDGCKLTVEGRAGIGVRSNFYNRIADSEKAKLREEVWNLSEQSAGMCILFTTNSSSIHVKWKLRSKQHMPHLTDCVTNGIDLYALDIMSGKWLWAGLYKPYKELENEGVILKDLPKQQRYYQLYLPTYNAVDSVFIGVDHDAEVQAYVRQSAYKPIVFYGTSIMQGASASRAGLTSTAMLGRLFDVETINLGFSGNARMEEPIGNIMTSIDASCYVVDCLPNMTEEMLVERTIPFIQQLKAAKPATPIILVESSENESSWINVEAANRIKRKNNLLKQAYLRLKDDGYTNIYFLSLAGVSGSGSGATVDGTHFNDVAYARYVERIAPLLKQVLGVD